MAESEVERAKGEIEQVTVSEQDAYTAVQLYSEYTAQESSRRKERAEKEAALLAAAYSPLLALVEGDPDARSARRELESLLEFEEENLASTRAQAEDSMRDFSDPLIEVTPFALPGSSVFDPPYEFASSKLGSTLGRATLDKAEGRFAALEEVGPSATVFETIAALGFAMRSPTAVTVRVSAYMPIHWEINVEPKSGGGYVGVEFYAALRVWKAGMDNPVINKVPLLHTLFQPMPRPFFDSGDTLIGDHTSDADRRLSMEANRTYFVWHDGIVRAVGNKNRVRAKINCRLQFVVVAPP
jgi:hypothetical protein